MRLSQYIERQPERRRASRRKSDRHKSVLTHPVFVPMVTIWATALLGLVTFVLPAAAIERFGMVTGIGLAEGSARFAFSGLAALLGAVLGFVASGAVQTAAIRRADDDKLVSAVQSRRNGPIDPVSELGSESLDAPIETMPFSDEPVEDGIFEALTETDEEAEPDFPIEQEPLLVEKPEKSGERKPTLGEMSRRGYEIEAPEEAPSPKDKRKKSEWAFTHKQFQSALIETCEGATCEAESELPPPLAEEAARRDLPGRPEQLDLSEFAQLPGRNAVWVEDEQPQAEPTRPEIPAASALEKLRQKPPEELSLVEMVERFAGALHDRQEAERQTADSGGPNRDAALAEALKALSIFTSQGLDQKPGQDVATPKPQADDPRLATTESELRDALAKLQNLRGAA